MNNGFSVLKSAFERVSLAGILCGGLMAGLTPLVQKASAQTSPLNPCPSIYYEEPFNTNVVTPAGCPPNALTQQLQQGQVPQQEPIPQRPIGGDQGTQMPLETGTPIAQIQPSNGMADIQLRNTTNVDIYYEVTGQTDRRILPPRQETYLRNIPLPANITTVRTDDGLLQVISEPSETLPGNVLVLSLDEDPTFDDTQGVIRIQSDGQVFVN